MMGGAAATMKKLCKLVATVSVPITAVVVKSYEVVFYSSTSGASQFQQFLFDTTRTANVDLCDRVVGIH